MQRRDFLKQTLALTAGATVAAPLLRGRAALAATPATSPDASPASKPAKSAVEAKSFTDPKTGAKIRQLTNYRGHSFHFYYTNSSFWDNGKKLLIGSHRNNAENLFTIDLESGAITQVTDFTPQQRSLAQNAFINPLRPEAYITGGGAMMAVDLLTCKRRTIYTPPKGYVFNNQSVTADGKTLCFMIENSVDKLPKGTPHHGQIIAMDLDSLKPRVVCDDKYPLSHINTSPTMPNLLTYAHEHPQGWGHVDQRMWIVDLNTDKVEPLRPKVPGDSVGHEYWFVDGQRVGFHGGLAGHKGSIWGFINYDNTGLQAFDLAIGSHHFHSLDENLIVGDGAGALRQLFLWRRKGDKMEGPRTMLTHGGSFETQWSDVHPRMFVDLDGKTKVLYTSDVEGYCNVYIAEIPDFDSLPEVNVAAAKK